jgi:hypothetical protein
VVDVLTLTNGSVYPRIAWESVLDAATLSSASSSEVDGSLEQIADWKPWSFWRPTGSGPYIVEAILDGAQTVNGWAMAGHDASGLIGMDTWNGAAWVVYDEFVHAGDGTVVYRNGDPISTTKLRFRFADVSFISILWAGTDMVLPEGIGPGWTDPRLALRADLNPEVSRDGVYLGSAVEQWVANQTLEVKNLEAAWVRDEWLPFLRTCSTRPFFLHWHNVDWPTSACLCTKAKFGGSAFGGKDFIDVSVSFDIDTGYDRRLTASTEDPALLTEETGGGPLLLE